MENEKLFALLTKYERIGTIQTPFAPTPLVKSRRTWFNRRQLTESDSEQSIAIRPCSKHFFQ
jgi:hypothetical protein